MILSEHQSKLLCAKYDISIPRGFIVSSPEEAVQHAGEIGFPCLLKAQVPLLNRMSEGGIREAYNYDEFMTHIHNLFLMKIHGHDVAQVLIEKKIEFVDEINLSILLDCSTGIHCARIAYAGSKKDDVVLTVRPDTHARESLTAVRDAGVPEAVIPHIVSIFLKMQKMYMEHDILLCRIHPVLISFSGECIAGDVHVSIDDNALFRHTEIMH